MDVPLLRTLQSIKRIEDDPSMRFQTEKIDLATIIPKYENIVVVDQQWNHSTVVQNSQESERKYLVTRPSIC